MKQAIVITSIFPPTDAVRKFARQKDWRLIVVGDRKTPIDWACDSVRYLSPDDQEASDYAISSRLPWNHYARKMMGYLEAMAGGANVIVDTDDDNIPLSDWSFPAFEGVFPVTGQGRGFVNVYRFFSDQNVWPRGFPLSRVLDPESFPDAIPLTRKRITVGVWQGLVDGEPDVDAVFRLTAARPVMFSDREPIVLERGCVSPFNSQNTAICRELFPLLYLPAYVTFRFTDILRGLVAQPIMWQAGFRVGFTRATVVQRRNDHDSMADFESEIPVYLYSEKVADVVSEAVRPRYAVSENLKVAYDALHRSGIVRAEELELLRAWLEDVERFR